MSTQSESTLRYSKSYRCYALGGLTAVWTINLVDRGLIAVLLQPIKVDLQLSDTQLGFLTGLAFALFYAVAGIPIARWSDRHNRVTIASLALGLWGMTMIASVLILNFAQLVVARILAAIGEAGCKPSTYSLVGDYYPEPRERLRAMSIYLTGSPLASLLSFVIGGALGELVGWRMTFAIMGLPGIVLAIIFAFTVREPRRDRELARGAEPVVLPPLSAVFRTLWTDRALRHLCAALIVIYGMGGGFAGWYGALLARSHGLSTAQIGLALGLVLSISGFVGALLGGSASTRLFGSTETGQMRFCALASIAMVPCFVGFVLLPTTWAALAALFPAVMCVFLSQAPAYALMQRLVPDTMRATMMAVVMLLVSGLGTGLGPQLVGLLSDALAPRSGIESLRYALLVFAFGGFWAAFHFARISAVLGCGDAGGQVEHADGLR